MRDGTVTRNVWARGTEELTELIKGGESSLSTFGLSD